MTFLQKNCCRILNNLGSTYLNWALLSDTRSDGHLTNFTLAGTNFQQASTRDANYGFAYYNLGTIYAHFGDMQSAHDAFAKAAEALPEDTVSLFQLGMTKATLGDEEGAITLWKQAQAAPYFVNQSGSNRKDDPDSALRDARRALIIDPQFLPAYHALGEILSAQKNYTDALQAYQTAVAIAPEDVKSLQRLGETLRRLDEDDEAAAVFQRALIQAPAYTPAMHGLASIYAEYAQCEQAGTVLQPLLFSSAETSDTATALRTIGRCYIQRQNPGYALPYLEQLAGFDTATTQDLMQLARAYEALERNGDAVQVYHHILLLDSDYKPAQQALVRIKEEGQ